MSPAHRKRVLLFGPATASSPRLETLLADRRFRDAYAEACALAEKELGWSPADDRESLHDDAAKRFERNFVQEVAVQLALFRALSEYGHRFDAIAGISLGELAAAHASGALTFEEAIFVTCRMVAVVVAAGGGDLLLVQASGEDAMAALEGLPVESIIDWPDASVLAVRDENLAELKRRFAAGRMEYTILDVGCMPHTDAVNRETFAGSVGHVPARLPALPYYSCVQGGKVEIPVDADFWVRMCSRPAQFREMHAALRHDGFRDVVNVGTISVDQTIFSALPPEERPPVTRADSLLPGVRNRR